MNWYKKAQNQNIITLIAEWLRSVKDQDRPDYDASNLMDNIRAFSGEMNTPDEINNSIQSASNIVFQEQGNHLTDHQQNFLMSIRSLNQPVDQTTIEQPVTTQPLQNQEEYVEPLPTI